MISRQTGITFWNYRRCKQTPSIFSCLQTKKMAPSSNFHTLNSSPSSSPVTCTRDLAAKFVLPCSTYCFCWSALVYFCLSTDRFSPWSQKTYKEQLWRVTLRPNFARRSFQEMIRIFPYVLVGSDETDSAEGWYIGEIKAHQQNKYLGAGTFAQMILDWYHKWNISGEILIFSTDNICEIHPRYAYSSFYKNQGKFWSRYRHLYSETLAEIMSGERIILGLNLV